MLSLILSGTAIAAESRASSRLSRYSAELFAGNDGNLYVLFSVIASNTMDVLGASNITIQRYNGSRWDTECTLTVKDTPEMQTSNAAQYSASIPYEPNYSNANYRAVVTFYAKDSSGSSTAQVITK
ncbi:MAG: hypothetical protein K2O18_15225 [Oscillospiraceae bacterium]|nr:hypothetical protein [Oscillospiraceae bacterium]